MKKFLLLPLLAVMALASQAWGVYSVCTGSYAGSCKWSLAATAGCDKIAIDPDESWSKATCKEAYENCEANGYLYSDDACKTWSSKGNDPAFNNGVAIWCRWASSCQPIKNETTLASCIRDGYVFKTVPDAGVSTSENDGKTCAGGTWTGQGRNPNAAVLGCCKWSGESNCYPIYDDIDPIDGESGATKVTNCKSGSNKFWAGSGTCPLACPTTTPTYPPPASSSSAAVSGTSSSSVGSSASSSSVGGSSSSVGSGSSSSGVGGSSSSGESTDPIISYNKAPVVGLSVVHYARSLQIASGKEAIVALFDMQGKQVFSQKVLSGTTTISLEKQRQGIYYAVVSSGSQKQTVKVVLK